jgi:mono/diheme cytochrome c family protein
MKIFFSWAGVFIWFFILVLPKAFSNSLDSETGRDIFFKHCRACHGDKGDGKTFAANVLNPPPKNFTSEKSKQELTEDRMIQSVTEGRKGTAMMPWKSRLTQKEIHAVVLYIRESLMQFESLVETDGR